MSSEGKKNSTNQLIKTVMLAPCKQLPGWVIWVHVEWEKKSCCKYNQKQGMHQSKHSDLQEGEFWNLHSWK